VGRSCVHAALSPTSNLLPPLSLTRTHTDPHRTGKFDEKHIRQVLRAAQWLILLFLLVQIAALVVALLMRFFIRGDGGEDATNFAAEELAERVVSMQHLRTDVEGGRGSSVRNQKYNKVGHGRRRGGGGGRVGGGWGDGVGGGAFK
jgi:hypothetical protein